MAREIRSFARTRSMIPCSIACRGMPNTAQLSCDSAIAHAPARFIAIAGAMETGGLSPGSGGYVQARFRRRRVAAGKYPRPRAAGKLAEELADALDHGLTLNEQGVDCDPGCQSLVRDDDDALALRGRVFHPEDAAEPRVR